MPCSLLGRLALVAAGVTLAHSNDSTSTKPPAASTAPPSTSSAKSSSSSVPPAATAQLATALNSTAQPAAASPVALPLAVAPSGNLTESFVQKQASSLPWWGWLLTLLGIGLLAGLVCAVMICSSRKKKVKRQTRGKADLKPADAEEEPLVGTATMHPQEVASSMQPWPMYAPRHGGGFLRPPHQSTSMVMGPAAMPMYSPVPQMVHPPAPLQPMVYSRPLMSSPATAPSMPMNGMIAPANMYMAPSGMYSSTPPSSYVPGIGTAYHSGSVTPPAPSSPMLGYRASSSEPPALFTSTAQGYRSGNADPYY